MINASIALTLADILPAEQGPENMISASLALGIGAVAVLIAAFLGRLSTRAEVLKYRAALNEKWEGQQAIADEAAAAVEKVRLEAAAEIEQAKAETRHWKRRQEEQFEQIDGTVGEKNAIWALYRRETLMAGRAQDWLMRELSEAFQGLNILRSRLRDKDGKMLPPMQPSAQLREVLATHAEIVGEVQDEEDAPTFESSEQIRAVMKENDPERYAIRSGEPREAIPEGTLMPQQRPGATP